MAFTKTNSACVDAKRIISSSSPKKKQKSPNIRNGELSGNVPVRLHTETRRKVAGTICHQSLVEEDADLDEQFGMERCLDDKECMWLSSDFTSPSSFFEEQKLSSPFHSHADDCLISWLPTLGNSFVHFSMKTTADAEENFQESLKEKGGTTRSPNSPGNDEMDSCSSLISDTERRCLSLSFMSLDGEDSKQNSDAEFDSEHQKSNNASPMAPAKVEHEKLNDDLSLKQASEAEDLEDFSADEPLFWPFEHEKDWSSEDTWKCFSMSPRKSWMKVVTPEKKPVESTRLRFHGRKMHPKDGCRRKLVLNSASTASKILELKQRNNNNRAKKLEHMPSRLRNSNKFSVKVVPLEIEDDHKTEPTETKVPLLKPFCVDRNLFKDDFALNDDLPIEIVLGLGEFDGHEGVDADLNEDVFFLEQSS